MGKQVTSCACRIWPKEKKELNLLWGMPRTWGCVAAATCSLQVGSWVGVTGWEMGLTRNMEMGLARNHLELTRNMWRHQIRSWKRSCQWSDVWRRPVGIGCLVGCYLYTAFYSVIHSSFNIILCWHNFVQAKFMTCHLLNYVLITCATTMTKLRISQPRKAKKYLLYLFRRWTVKVSTKVSTFSSTSSTTLDLQSELARCFMRLPSRESQTARGQ